MDQPLLLRGARVIDPANGIDAVRDIGIADGILVPPGDLASPQVLDLGGHVLCPGFVDIHVHMREPGQTAKETIASGTKAAAAGGFTTVVAMPNTIPAVDSPEHLATVNKLIERHAVVRVLQSAALTAGRAGSELTNAAALKRAGAVALTDDGSCIQDAGLMLKALEQARDAGLPVIDHCEDSSLAAYGAMHLGKVSEELGLPGKCSASEDVIVARNCFLAKEANWPVHMQHISSAEAVAQVRFAQSRGIPVTAEATPHHIALTDRACVKHGTNAKMNPPLRTEDDRQAILRGLQDGTITAIATDHAPHTASEKALPFAEAPCGITGLEAAAAICLTELYHAGLLTLPQLIALLTQGPATILGLACGTLNIGSPADITILDLDSNHVININESFSLARNCPYDGWECKGQVVATMVAGSWIFSRHSGIPSAVRLP